MTASRVVLVPLDGLSIAEGALPYAAALVPALGAALRLLIVVPRSQSDTSDSTSAAGEGARYLGAVAAALDTGGIPVSTVVEQGQPVDQILSAANSADVALVVMATHGRGGVERWIAGSVADTIMRRCNKPILLVVPSDLPSTPPPVELQHLLVPLDGSALAEAALPFAIEIATGSGATLTLVQVLSPPAAPGSTASDREKWQEERIAAVRAYLEAVRARLPETLPSEALVILASAPAPALTRFAQTERVDLTIMSTRGYGGIRRLTVGSVADEIVRSAVPTVLIRPAATESGDSAAENC